LAIAGDVVVEDVGGQHPDRNPAAGRLGAADLAQGRQAVEDRHVDVHQHQIESLGPPGLQGLGAVLGEHQRHRGGRQQGGQDPAVGGVVLGRQHPDRGGGTRNVGDGRGSRKRLAQPLDGEPEHRARLSRRVVDADLAAHQGQVGGAD